MTTTLRTLGLALGLCCVLSGACSERDAPEPDTGEPGGMIDRLAGQTGDEGATDWVPPGGAVQRGCPAWAEPVALDSLDGDTELGFSAADILDFSAGRHEVGVHWNAEPVSDYYALQVAPSGDDTLELTIHHDGEPARYRGLVVPDGGVLAPECRGQLDVGVKVELRSARGALDERWTGTLSADQVGETNLLLRAPVWRGRLPNQPKRHDAFDNALEGSLDVVDGDDPGSAFAWIDVVMRIRPDDIDGGVNGWVQNSEGGAFFVPSSIVDREGRSWIGVIGDGYFRNPWAVE